MQAKTLTKGIIRCSKCGQRIQRGATYYEISDMYLHVECWDVPTIFLSKQQLTERDNADPFIQAVKRNSVLGIKIGKMLVQLNAIRGDKKFNEMEFVSTKFVLKEYTKRRK